MFVVSSPSGGGKTTVVQQLRRLLPALDRSVSVTTRTPRRGERQGRHYHFVTREQFDRQRRAGEFLEWAKVHGAAYGTPKRPILDRLTRGRSVVLSIDVQGARQIRNALGDQAVLIFLMPPSRAALRERLVGRRTETAAAMRQRLRAAAREMRCARWYDYTVVNERIPDAARRLRMIVQRRYVPLGRERESHGAPAGGRSAQAV